MYAYVKATALESGLGKSWKTAYLEDTPLNQIKASYADVIFIISNPFLAEDVALYWADIPTNVKSLTVTLNQWFATIGNAALNTRAVPEEPQRTYMNVYEPQVKGYSIDLSNQNFDPDAQITQDEKPDLLIKNLEDAEFDHVTFSQQILVSVNGMIHKPEGSTEGIYIRNGGLSAQIAKDNRLSFLDFSGIGTLSFHSLSTGTVITPVQDLPLSDSVYVKFENMNFSDKIIAASVGGYLHFLDDVVKQVSNDTIMIDLKRFDLVSRFFQMEQRIDTSSLPVDRDEDKRDGVSLAQIQSDDYVKALLALDQSFLILLDAGGYHVETTYLQATGLPGKYYIDQLPKGIIIGEYGTIAEHTRVFEDGTWVLSIADYMKHNKVRDTTDYSRNARTNDANVSSSPWTYLRPYVLTISKDYEEQAA